MRGEIDSEHPSLVAAFDRSGEDVSLAIALADVFAGDIDFSHDLQPGDRFEIVFEQVLREGARAGYGDILAATFTGERHDLQRVPLRSCPMARPATTMPTAGRSSASSSPRRSSSSRA